jgi:hypothetical protein
MHRALCWATAVELNVVIAATSSDVAMSSSEPQVSESAATALHRTLKRACLAFIESSAQQRCGDPEYHELGRNRRKRFQDRAPSCQVDEFRRVRKQDPRTMRTPPKVWFRTYLVR